MLRCRSFLFTNGDRKHRCQWDYLHRVRIIVPREPHPLIFGTFEKLAPNDALSLVNDHNSNPLYYHFKTELGDVFSWDYLESWPNVSKVRIAKST